VCTVQAAVNGRWNGSIYADSSLLPRWDIKTRQTTRIHAGDVLMFLPVLTATAVSWLQYHCHWVDAWVATDKYFKLAVNVALQAGYLWACKGAKFIGNKHTNSRPTSVLPVLLTNIFAYFHFQFLFLICLYSLVEVKWLPTVDSKILSRATKRIVNEHCKSHTLTRLSFQPVGLSICLLSLAWVVYPTWIGWEVRNSFGRKLVRPAPARSGH